MAIKTETKTETGVKPNGEEKDKTATGTETDPKTEGNEEGEEDEGEDGADDDKKADPAYVAKLKAESIQRRQENKKVKGELAKTQAELERYKKGLAIIQGKEKPELDPVEVATKEGDRKLRNAMLKSEIAAQATDANDVGLLFDGFRSRFSEVEVDTDNESVDSEAVKEVLGTLRKEKPFLFRMDGDNGDKRRGGALPPDGNGRPNKGGSEYATWKQMQTQNRPQAEIQAYYNKNRAAIISGAPK